MSIEQFDINTNAIITAKRQRLAERQAKTPSAAVLALAEMQARPHPILNVVTAHQAISVIGQITHEEVYDPVSKALRYARMGVDSIAFYTDQHIYDNGLEDLLLVGRAVQCPILSKDYILDDYHVTEARAAGAAALTLYASILDDLTLRRTVSLTQRWRMTSIVQVETEAQMAYVRELSPHVIAVGSVQHPPNIQHDLDRLAKLRQSIPYNSHYMLLHPLTSLDDVAAALSLGVDALIIDEQILDNPRHYEQLQSQISEHLANFDDKQH